ncbi:DUF3006 domain-containing protein [Megamonas funiformis]|uniref:DUF3006 domain-containing protein n=1 Tax=Megamonas funiformis TaxID=437897 RepID=UPI00195D7E1A|nr:DUF3006 domain-containing protein [Megamonas funiformis]MBM6649707.1 DUF3006 domain-containing protein [Megamonas funiformis]
MISAVIDRFEEDKVVLLVGEDEQKVVFPKNLLDKNLKEGDYLSIDIKYDEVATKKAVAEIEDLLKSLKNDNK